MRLIPVKLLRDPPVKLSFRLCGILLQPFMPSKAGMLLDALSVEPEQRTMEYAELGKGAIGEVRSVRLFDVPKSKVGSE